MWTRILLGLSWAATLVIAFFVGDYWHLQKTTVVPTEYGRFLSKPKVEFIGEQKAKLLEDFVYVDPDDNPWLAPKATEINGASIPREFWSLAGAPFSGKYFNASIVHDSECVLRKRPAHNVHLMFYHACLAGGVEPKKAKLLYWAVARFGPIWVPEQKTRTIQYTNHEGEMASVETSYQVNVPQLRSGPTNEDVDWARTYFEEHDPPVEAIPRLRMEPSPLEAPR